MLNNEISGENVNSNEEYTKKPVQVRTILWFLVFLTMGVNNMDVINMYIALPDMVLQNNISNDNLSQIYECYTRNDTNVYIINDFNLEVIQEHTNKKKFDYNEYEQGLIIGSAYWLIILVCIPAAILSRKFGSKIVLGISMSIQMLLCFVVPIASETHLYVLIFVRAIQGLLSGFCWPALHHLIAQWIPPNDRSKYVTAYMGGTVTVIIVNPLCGYIISVATWKWTFHLCGMCGIVWFVLWQYFVYDTPSKHPRIDMAEREFIENALKDIVEYDNKITVPWRQILSARVVWISIFAQFSVMWSVITITQQTPTYFKTVLGLNIETTGVIAGLPHILRVLFALSFSTFCDYLLAAKKISRTNIRKMAMTICCTIQGFFVLGLSYAGCNFTMSIVILVFAIMLTGAESAGVLSSIVDLSPNFASVLLGVLTTVCLSCGFISPYVVGTLTLNNNTTEQWRYVFLITSVMLISCGILYAIFGDSNTQKWNGGSQNVVKHSMALNASNKIVDASNSVDGLSANGVICNLHRSRVEM